MDIIDLLQQEFQRAKEVRYEFCEEMVQESLLCGPVDLSNKSINSTATLPAYNMTASGTLTNTSISLDSFLEIKV